MCVCMCVYSEYMIYYLNLRSEIRNYRVIQCLKDMYII